MDSNQSDDSNDEVPLKRSLEKQYTADENIDIDDETSTISNND